MDDLSKLLLGVIPSGVGAYIALVFKDKFDSRAQKRVADVEEFKRIRTLVPDALIAALQSTDFYAGQSKASVFTPLQEFVYTFESGRYLIFHNRALNEKILSIVAVSNLYLQQVATLTTLDGDPPQQSTRSRSRDRDDEQEAQWEAEGRDLNTSAKDIANDLNRFIDLGKRTLRL